MKKFPTKLFVKIENDGDNSYFVAGSVLVCGPRYAQMGETIEIGIYQLVETTYIETVIKTSGTVEK